VACGRHWADALRLGISFRESQAHRPTAATPSTPQTSHRGESAVHAGTDPVTGKERFLGQTCPDEAAAHAALSRMLLEAT
jgi:hypothetical protein